MDHNKELKITIGTHFFKVTMIKSAARVAIYKFINNYVQFKLEKVPRSNRFIRVPSAIYASALKDRSEFRFHINQYKDFIHCLELNNIPRSLIETETLEINPGKDLRSKAKPDWVLRDDQIPIHSYLLGKEDKELQRSKLVGIQTGKGKTFISMKFASDHGKRIAIVVRPMFIYKWVGDVEKYLDIDTSKRVMVIQGTAELMALFEQQRQGLLEDIDVFIFSNKTLQIWFKQYQEFGESIREQGYGITPEEMYQFLNVGLRLIDEVHLDFHLNFKIDLYTNVEKSVSLSATLDHKDPFIRRMYELAYPLEYRFKEQEIDKYAVARCVLYSIKDALLHKIKTTEFGSKSYSQNAYEEYLMKRPQKLHNYLNLIKHTVDVGFMQDYVKGERCVIFAFRKDLCSLIVDRLRLAYPGLDIRRYVAEDPDENMYEPDIRVTTLGSGSTGHDIARLKTAIMTVNVDSVQANIQAFGRLRKIDDLTPRFYYFTCIDIPKHMQYHRAKEELMAKRALNFNIIQSPFQI